MLFLLNHSKVKLRPCPYKILPLLPSAGSSSDQDSFAYRYGETDSGLGRATPPRRAPSPGMGSLRHLPSPSGPGSLLGLMSKGRRMFDDGSSDISSTPSSMMDYNGENIFFVRFGNPFLFLFINLECNNHSLVNY